MDHVGIKTNSYKEFRRTGTIESPYFMRMFVAHCMWLTLCYLIGGWSFVFSWLSASFLFIAMLRSFNWVAHGGIEACLGNKPLDVAKDSCALKQWFYGFLAGEWHYNHYSCSRSANTAFSDFQIDIPFYIIKFLQKIGVIESYRNK